MLVGGTYRFRAGVDQRVGLKRFQAWKPPAGFTFQGHWSTADGMGGMFIAEADSAAAAFEGCKKFPAVVTSSLSSAPHLDARAESIRLIRPIRGIRVNLCRRCWPLSLVAVGVWLEEVDRPAYPRATRHPARQRSDPPPPPGAPARPPPQRRQCQRPRRQRGRRRGPAPRRHTTAPQAAARAQSRRRAPA